MDRSPGSSLPLLGNDAVKEGFQLPRQAVDLVQGTGWEVEKSTPASLRGLHRKRDGRVQ
jgi:hypothetical protein